MTDTLPTTGSPSLSTMARIEARRFARNPIFLVGFLLPTLLLLPVAVLNDDPQVTDLLSWPVAPAFFIGLTSLLVMARQTRSTEGAAEAMSAAPGTEARRTLALALACLVPFTAGLVWLSFQLVIAATYDIAPQEWWFGTMPDWQVWSILLALIPVACLGGGLLGVLTGRWLRFPGAPVVVLVALVFACMVGQIGIDDRDDVFLTDLRLLLPWALFHSGTLEDGTASVYPGNPAFYLVHLLCLCAAAVIAAVWHDRGARTRQLRLLFAGVVVVGLVSSGLAMATGNEHTQVSDPIPWKVAD